MCVTKSTAGGYEPALVVLVDDQFPVRDVLARQLELLGCDVIAVDSGARALAAIGECAGAVDLVLTDIDMPGMDGWTLGRTLRELHPHLPVVYMSGRAEACTLEKPFTSQRLRDVLQAALKSR